MSASNASYVIQKLTMSANDVQMIDTYLLYVIFGRSTRYVHIRSKLIQILMVWKRSKTNAPMVIFVCANITIGAFVFDAILIKKHACYFQHFNFSYVAKSQFS